MSKMKLLSLAAAATIAIISASYAGGPGHQAMPMAQNDLGKGIFLGLNYATYGGNDYAVMLGYMNPMFSGELGVSFENTIVANGSSSHVYELRGDIGLRHALMNTLYFTYGALGSYGFRSPSSTATRSEPFAVGGYIGVDYQPIHRLLLSFKLSPYTYYRDYQKIKHDDVFSDGSFGVSYVFNV